ncbi:hypothetical protein B0H19DRAFT_1149868 [Mycena capillaripes]|nr:hypothetical protein B0H19DRAFT_1149868 [Mycena capillaripes]
MHRGPPGPGHSNFDWYNRYFWNMTPQQRAAVVRIRFFTPLFLLEGRTFQTWDTGLTIRELTITVRHSDWRDWERGGSPLRIQSPRQAPKLKRSGSAESLANSVRHTIWQNWETRNGGEARLKAPHIARRGQEGWGGWVGSMPRLQELEIEFETTEAKKQQLEEQVRIALGWKFILNDGDSLVHDGEPPTKSMWLGTSRVSLGQSLAPDGDEAALDLRFPLDLKLHVRKFKFVKESRLLRARTALK